MKPRFQKSSAVFGGVDGGDEVGGRAAGEGEVLAGIVIDLNHGARGSGGAVEGVEVSRVGAEGEVIDGGVGGGIDVARGGW